MFTFKVGDKEYKVKFTYGLLCKTDLMDRIMNQSQDTGANAFRSSMENVAELILAGLQKNHKDEFGYDSDSEKDAAIDKVFNLMDEYEDESTEENPQNGYTLFNACFNELMKNGFLSQMRKETATKSENQNATMIPQDHKPKNDN